jgi:hypothetical protein
MISPPSAPWRSSHDFTPQRAPWHHGNGAARPPEPNTQDAPTTTCSRAWALPDSARHFACATRHSSGHSGPATPPPEASCSLPPDVIWDRCCVGTCWYVVVALCLLASVHLLLQLLLLLLLLRPHHRLHTPPNTREGYIGIHYYLPCIPTRCFRVPWTRTARTTCAACTNRQRLQSVPAPSTAVFGAVSSLTVYLF